MNKICYKCVSVVNGKFFSAMKSYIQDEFVLRYEIDKTTFPKKGRIYVFETLDAAIKFKRNNCGYGAVRFIMEGMATNIGFPKHISKINEIDIFWKYKSSKKNVPEGILKMFIPEKTMTCSSFTPIGLVDYE